MNGHHHAFPFWLKAKLKGRGRPLGPLLHFDTHDDMVPLPFPEKFRAALSDLRKGRRLKESWRTLESIVNDCSTPLSAAVLSGSHRRLIWGKPAATSEFPEFLGREFFYAYPRKGVPASAMLPGLTVEEREELQSQIRDARLKPYHFRLFHDRGLKRKRAGIPWNYAWITVAPLHRPVKKRLALLRPIDFTILNLDSPVDRYGKGLGAANFKKLLKVLPRAPFTLDIDLDYFASVDTTAGFRRRPGCDPGYKIRLFERQRAFLKERLGRFQRLLTALRDKKRTPSLVTIADSTFVIFALDKVAEGQEEFTPIEHAAYLRRELRRILHEVYGDKVIDGRPRELQGEDWGLERLECHEGRPSGERGGGGALPAFNSRHNPGAVCLLKEMMKPSFSIESRKATPVERAVVAGLYWLVRFTEKSAAFNAVFPEYVTLLDRAALNGKGHPIGALAVRLLRGAFKRARPRLAELFSADLEGKRRFISMLPPLFNQGLPKKEFLSFYRAHFPRGFHGPGKQPFERAMEKGDHEVLGDLLAEEGALDHFLKRHRGSPLALPGSRLDSYLGQIEKWPFKQTFKGDRSGYLNQTALVARMITLLGRRAGGALPPTRFARRLELHLREALLLLSLPMEEIELSALVLEAARYLGKGRRPEVRALARALLKGQLKDGSWGSKEDRDENNPQSVMAPTWAMVNALGARLGPRWGTSAAAGARARGPVKPARPAGSACLQREGVPPVFRSRHNPKTVAKLRAAMTRTASRLERALLAGLHWVVKLIDDDDNFDEAFGDYTTMMSEMAIYGKGSTPGKLAAELLRSAFHRARDRLPWIFEKDLADKGDFITILYMLYKFNIPKGPFIKFYRTYFPKGQPRPHKATFEQAFRKKNYDVMGTHLIDEAFLDIFELKHPGNPFKLRKSKLKRYIGMLDKLPFIHSKSNVKGFSDQNYFITHIVLAINHYGETPFPDTALTRRIYKYLVKHLPVIRHEVKDLDLLAEFVYCFRIYGKADRPDVQEAVTYMLDLQHGDGSWGTDEDFSGTLYQVMHPTWAVLTGLAEMKASGQPR